MIRCEVYSRVSGYYRPVNQWNKGKKEEMLERKFISKESVLSGIDKKIRIKK